MSDYPAHGSRVTYSDGRVEYVHELPSAIIRRVLAEDRGAAVSPMRVADFPVEFGGTPAPAPTVRHGWRGTIRGMKIRTASDRRFLVVSGMGQVVKRTDSIETARREIGGGVVRFIVDTATGEETH